MSIRSKKEIRRHVLRCSMAVTPHSSIRCASGPSRGTTRRARTECVSGARSLANSIVRIDPAVSKLVVTSLDLAAEGCDGEALLPGLL